MKGVFEIKTAWDGDVLAGIPVWNSNVWVEGTADIHIPDGIHSIYLTYRGSGDHIQLKSFEFLV